MKEMRIVNGPLYDLVVRFSPEAGDLNEVQLRIIQGVLIAGMSQIAVNELFKVIKDIVADPKWYEESIK